MRNVRSIAIFLPTDAKKNYGLFALFLFNGMCQKEGHKPASSKDARHVGNVTKKTTSHAVENPTTQKAKVAAPSSKNTPTTSNNFPVENPTTQKAKVAAPSSKNTPTTSSSLPAENLTNQKDKVAAPSSKNTPTTSSSLAAENPTTQKTAASSSIGCAIESPTDSSYTSSHPSVDNSNMIPLEQQKELLPKYYINAGLTELPGYPKRLILGSRSASYGDVVSMKQPHGVLKPRKGDVTVDYVAFEGQIEHEEHRQGDAFSEQFVQEIQEKYGKDSFGTIVCERLSLPLNWTSYARKKILEKEDRLGILANSVYVTECYNVNTSDIFAYPSLELILTDSIEDSPNTENPVLTRYLELLAPGGTFYYLSQANSVNQYGGFYPHFESNNNKHMRFFDDNFNDENMQAVYCSIFERAGFTKVTFYQDPDFETDIVFLTAIKP